MKRVFLITLDSFGIGNAPDAAAFGDGGADTLKGCSETGLLEVPTLIRAGLGCIDGVTAVPKTDKPTARVARLSEESAGKDTTIGHFEIAGLVYERPFPVFPDGFPEEVLRPFREKTGRGVLCNRPMSGTDVIREYGEEHLRSGDLIVYTSADSVFQIAAHTAVVPEETLYEYCRIARDILTGKHGVARVIARPFTGEVGSFFRTDGRRDFSVEPGGKTLLDALSLAGRDVIAVGKINDIFAGRGITEFIPAHGNGEAMRATRDLLDRDFSGLAFINLVDFDMLFGHRRDPVGYARALGEFDAFLRDFLPAMRQEDLLILTADHGCDPTFTRTTDHTRECVPYLSFGATVTPGNAGTLRGFYHIARDIAGYLGIEYPVPVRVG